MIAAPPKQLHHRHRRCGHQHIHAAISTATMVLEICCMPKLDVSSEHLPLSAKCQEAYVAGRERGLDEGPSVGSRTQTSKRRGRLRRTALVPALAILSLRAQACTSAVLMHVRLLVKGPRADLREQAVAAMRLHVRELGSVWWCGSAGEAGVQTARHGGQICQQLCVRLHGARAQSAQCRCHLNSITCFSTPARTRWSNRSERDDDTCQRSC